MDPEYRHTQFGWVIVAIVVGVGFLVVPRLGIPGAELGLGFFGLLFGVILLLFGALTVEVDRDEIRLWFGVGLVRKRIPLGEVAAWHAVRNPWYSGWGIRLGPWGVLWNVSGFDAVELALSDGSRFRIGTDQPAELVAAIGRAKGQATAVPAPVVRDGPRVPEGGPIVPGGGGGGTRWPLAIGLGLLLLSGLFWAEMRPPTVEVSQQRLDVRSLVYGVSIPAADITRVTLEATPPRVLLRTNGFALAGRLRGQFRVEGLGDGRLFVEWGHPPYLLVRHLGGFVILNFEEPTRTRAVFEAMAAAWPDRIAPRSDGPPRS